jgi:hypothetical protein
MLFLTVFNGCKCKCKMYTSTLSGSKYIIFLSLQFLSFRIYIASYGCLYLVLFPFRLPPISQNKLSASLSESREDDVSQQEFPASSELMELLKVAKHNLRLEKDTETVTIFQLCMFYVTSYSLPHQRGRRQKK